MFFTVGQYLLLYGLLYSPVFRLTGSSGAIFFMGLSLLLLARSYRKFHLLLDVWVFSIFVLFVFCFVVAQMFAYLGGGDSAVITAFVSLAFYFFPCAALLLISVLPKEEGLVNKILFMIFCLGALQGACIVADFFSPRIREIFSQIVIQHPSLEFSLVRAGGLTSSTGDTLSFIQAFTGVVGVYLLASGVTGRWLFSVFFALISLSIIFTGRSGLILFLFGAAYLFYLYKGGLRTLSLAFCTFFVLTAFGMVAVWLAPESLYLLMFDKVIPYAFELFFSLANEGRLDSSSTNDILDNMIIFPDSLSQWLVGDGYFSDPLVPEYNYMGTDLGYLRFLFYFGLLGSLFIYLFYILVFGVAYRFSDVMLRKLILVIFIMFFVAHLKVVTLFYGPIFLLPVILAMAARFDRRRLL